MKINKINTDTFRAKCLLIIIAFLNIVVVIFQGGASSIIGQIILGILLVSGNNIVRDLFIISSILGIPVAIFARISNNISIFKIDLYFVFFILYCIFTFCILMYNKDILKYIKTKKDEKIKKQEKNKTNTNKSKHTKKIVTLIVIIGLCVSAFFYLTAPVNHIDVSEDIKNYDLGEGIVFVELNYQGSTSVDIDEHWNMEKFDNGLPITAWEYYRLTDGFIENAKKIYANFPNIETDDEVIIISLGRKLENLYYYKQSGYINLYSEVAYIGEPVFSKEYYEDTMFVYTSPTYIKFPYYEDTDDNIRFNKEGDIPYEIRPYKERSNNNRSKLIREETRLDVILKKLKN